MYPINVFKRLDSKQYIESGIIESFVLGLLDRQEAQEVERRAAEDPAVQKAIDECRQALASYAQTFSVSPRPEWKNEIINAALAEDKSATITHEPVVKPMELEEKPRSSNSRFLAIAASLLFLASAAFNIRQYRHLNDVKDNLTRTQMRIAELESNNQVLTANYKSLKNDIDIMSDPATSTVVMKAIEGRDPDCRANIYWNSNTQTVYLDVVSLPKAPAGKQYQLWAIKDGQTMSMGVFNADQLNAMHKMGTVDRADAFAVTLEPEGGSPAPHMDQMYVMGKTAIS